MTPTYSWTDGYRALRRRAIDVRGLDEIHADFGESASWPRTTGADAIEIAALFDPAVKNYGSPGLQRRWAARLHELARDAVHALDATYPENRVFWRALEDVSVFFDDVTVPSPRQGMWEALISRIGAANELRNSGPTEDGPFAHFEGIKTYDGLWEAQRKYLADRRGFDWLPPPPGFGGSELDIPRSTNADVLQLATYWTHALANTRHLMGYDGVAAKWRVALADVNRLAKTGKPDDVYPMNNELWRAALRVAIQVAVTDEAPSKWSMIVDSVTESISHLPQTLGHAASKGAEVVAETANAAGHVVAEAGKGLFGGIKTPVLVGAGLLGLYLLHRHHQHGEA